MFFMLKPKDRFNFDLSKKSSNQKEYYFFVNINE